MTRKKVNDIFPDWLTGSGIFSALNNYPVPWQIDNISTSLDLEYHGNISGEKFTSPLVNKLVAGSTITISELNKLAGVIYNMYGDNWNKEFNTLNMLYDPIENYSMTEQMSNDETVTEYGKTHTRTDNTTSTRTDNTTSTRTDNTTHAKTGTETRSPNTTNTGANSVYGFNSASAVPVNGSTNTETGTETVTYNTSDKDTGTVTNKDTGTVTNRDTGTVTDGDTGSDTSTRNYTLTRKGNIGTTTSQMMIQSERDLYLWNIFYKVVFPDIDKILTLDIY